MPDSSKQIIKKLQSQGFNVARQTGSHIVLNKQTPQGKVTTVVPNQKELRPGVVGDIEKQAGLPKGTLAGSGDVKKPTQNPADAGSAAAVPKNSSITPTLTDNKIKAVPLNNDLLGGKTKNPENNDLLGSKTSTIINDDLLGGKSKNIENNDLLGGQIKDPDNNDLLGSVGTNADRFLASASPTPADPVSDNVFEHGQGQPPAPAPYTGGAAVENVSHPSPGVTLTTTASGAVIEQSGDNSPYRVSPPVAPPDAWQANAGDISASINDNSTPPAAADSPADNAFEHGQGQPAAPAPYTGGAPVESFTQNPATAVSQTITGSGAVIDQAADGTAYRAGWVDPADPSQPMVASDPSNPDKNPYLNDSGTAYFVSDAASGGGYPDPGSQPVPVSASAADNLSDASSGGGYSAPSPQPAPDQTSSSMMVSDAASGGGYSAPSPQVDNTPIPISASAADNQSDASSGGGYSDPAPDPPPMPISDSAANDQSDASSGGGYGDNTDTNAPLPISSSAADNQSDASSGGGYAITLPEPTKATTPQIMPNAYNNPNIKANLH